ncbi:MAG: hydrogenase expression/formation protein [Planctomycetes bacterium]|nr:hydrogenase expression/formation protein [Planctomycetota bacterium]
MLPIGKVPAEILRRCLASNQIADERVVVGPRVGEDAAVIDFGETYLVAKTDPITFATDHIGWYSIHINANDIATMGARPRWFLGTVLFPEGQTDKALVETVFDDIRRSCNDLGIELVGGHMEITYEMPRTIVIGQMLGEVAKDKLVRNENGRAGDDVILTKGVAVEATSIIAREKAEELAGMFDEAFIERCRNFLIDPGISVVKDALTANGAAAVHAMHDPTEGGLATGLGELAGAAGCGIRIHADRIHIFDECEKLCGHFGLDPLGVIASGALLIAADPADTENILQVLAAEGIKADVIGQLTEETEGLKMDSAGTVCDLPVFLADEIARLF